MSVLAYNAIIDRINNEKLIEDYSLDNVKSCSYDLRMGHDYYYYDHNTEKGSDSNPVIKHLDNQHRLLSIPPDAICYVITKEEINMPADLTAQISLSFGLINQGIMLAIQPPFDPGYHGKTVALLHNLSDEPVEIEFEQHILNIVFYTLTEKISQEHLYNGKYKKLESLSDFLRRRRKGAVFMLAQELKKKSERFESSIPNILAIISVVLAILTVIVTFLTAGTIVKPTSSIDTGTQHIDINHKK